MIAFIAFTAIMLPLFILIALSLHTQYDQNH